MGDAIEQGGCHFGIAEHDPLQRPSSIFLPRDQNPSSLNPADFQNYLQDMKIVTAFGPRSQLCLQASLIHRHHNPIIADTFLCFGATARLTEWRRVERTW